jgi:DNA-binding beta-propeller fold protein YncE
MAVDPTGKYAYVANTGNGTIAQFTIGAGGALTPMSTPLISVGGQPADIHLDRSGTYVYVSNQAANSVSRFSIGTGGALALVSSIGGGSRSYYMSVDPTGQFVYLSDRNAATVSQYIVGAGGVLTPMGTPTAVTGTQPAGIVTTKEY